MPMSGDEITPAVDMCQAAQSLTITYKRSENLISWNELESATSHFSPICLYRHIMIIVLKVIIVLLMVFGGKSWHIFHMYSVDGDLMPLTVL